MTGLKIYPLPILKLMSTKSGLNDTINAGEHVTDIMPPIWSYASIWYIESAEKKILVDTGGSVGAMSRRGVSAEAIQSPADALEKVGLTPEEIDIVICTHLHCDHMTSGHLYNKAKFIIQKAELEANSNPQPMEAPRCVPESELKGLDFDVVEGDMPIVNGVSVLFTPGHTRGGQSVLIETERGKVIISGLCTTRNNFEPPEAVRK